MIFSNQKLAKDKGEELEECQRTINDLEAELRTRMREKDKFKADLSNLGISLKREQNNGADAEQTNQSYDVMIRQKNVQVSHKTTELHTTKEEIEKSGGANQQLGNDIEDIKKNIESIITINKDVTFDFLNKKRFWRK